MEQTDTAGRPRGAGQPLLPCPSPPARRSALVAALAIAAPLALFVPLAAEAWQKDVSTWDARVSRGLHEDEAQRLMISRIDVPHFILTQWSESPDFSSLCRCFSSCVQESARGWH